ncbi:MAG TPA: hypothetical protein PLM20_07860 [Syntrophomonadaceae bacterium]|nr:hypothetical protein [Syntrophomonadaceae bacterium]HQE23799.1 hypothetical protein [Syntrophomonadaceae bacterium]
MHKLPSNGYRCENALAIDKPEAFLCVIAPYGCKDGRSGTTDVRYSSLLMLAVPALLMFAIAHY